MDEYQDDPGDPDEDEFSELDDIDDRLRELHEAQTIWERIEYLQTAKMPCPECGGSGQLYGGTLGNTCPTCMGQRMVDHPGADDIKVPDFADMRQKLSAAATARDQRLGLRAATERRLALPAAGSLPTLAEIRDLARQGHEQANECRTAPMIEGDLRAPPRPRLDAPDDKQLDSLHEGGEESFASESSIGGEGLDDDYLDQLEDGEVD